MDEDGNVFDVSGLDPADPIYVTMTATEPLNTSSFVMEKVCQTDGEEIEMDCPLGTQTYTCDSSLGGVDGTYFLEFTCPRVVPTCMWWSEAEGDWAHEGCTLVNYTSTNVTCGCTHLTDFVLGTNISVATSDITYTSPPTALPLSSPTAVPSSLPTALPSSVSPTSLPTVAPSTSLPTTSKPSPVPSSEPTMAPTTRVSVLTQAWRGLKRRQSKRIQSTP